MKNEVGRYIEAGYSVTPLNGKEPYLKKWQTEALSLEQAKMVFGDGDNIGVVLGTASGGLVDVDIDDAVALRLAPHFLPATGTKFGRRSKRESHWLYMVPDPDKRIAFTGPDKGTLVELRGNGSQTMFPGSIHPSGEKVEFSDENGPSASTWAALLRSVERLSIATLLVKNWEVGKRHDLALATAGLLASAGWVETDTRHLIGAVASGAEDAEFDDRMNCVTTTYEAMRRGENYLSSGRLRDLLDESIVRRIQKWTGSSGDISRPSGVQSLQTDADCAAVFSEHYSDRLIFSDQDGEWFEKRRDVYSVIPKEKLQKLVMELGPELARKNSTYIGQTRKFASLGGINNMIQLSRSHLLTDASRFDQAHDLVGCRNGVLSLAKRQLIDPEDEIVTRRLGTKFDPDARCPIFEKFLERIFDGNKDVIEFVRRAVGYSLGGGVSEQVLFILIGKGANGKSTLLNVLSQLFGEYAGGLPMSSLTQQKYSGTQTNDLAGLVGKRFVSASEGEAGSKLAEARVKQMTGGDSISCRKLFKEFFEYVPQFKLWIATNDLPRIEGTSEAIWRRFQVIDFPVTIPVDERDGNLPKNLKAELPGILNWALAGYRDWFDHGLNSPESVKNATGSYRAENDIISLFVDECCVRMESGKTATSNLYASYENWAKINGHDVIPKNRFGKELNRLGFTGYKKSSGNGWRGIEIVDGAEVF